MAPGNRAPLSQLLPAMRSGGVAAVSELGVLGDPTAATAERGKELFEGSVRAFGEALAEVAAFEL